MSNDNCDVIKVNISTKELGRTTSTNLTFTAGDPENANERNLRHLEEFVEVVRTKISP